VNNISKTYLYIVVAFFSYWSVALLSFGDYFKTVARQILVPDMYSFDLFNVYIPFLGLCGLFAVPFTRRGKLLLGICLFCQIAPLVYLFYSEKFRNFSDPAFYVPALVYLIFATLIALSIFGSKRFSLTTYRG
jgi:hypothetical protein